MHNEHMERGISTIAKLGRIAGGQANIRNNHMRRARKYKAAIKNCPKMETSLRKLVSLYANCARNAQHRRLSYLRIKLANLN